MNKRVRRSNIYGTVYQLKSIAQFNLGNIYIVLTVCQALL